MAMGVAVAVGGLLGTPGRSVTRAPPCAKFVPPWFAGIALNP
jgi:hypothetical protein